MVPWCLSVRASYDLVKRLERYDARVSLPDEYARFEDIEIPFIFQWQTLLGDRYLMPGDGSIIPDLRFPHEPKCFGLVVEVL